MAPTSTFVDSPLTLLGSKESPFQYIQGTGRHSRCLSLTHTNTEFPLVVTAAINLPSLTRADTCPLEIIHQAFFPRPLLPSDEELFSKYLVPKTRGDIMKGFPMEDVNLCDHEPWDLPGKSIINVAGQVAWYFFCPRDLRGKVHRRKTKAGNWKPTSNTKSIMAEGTENEIGVIRALRFYEREVRTGWMIYEFDLVSEPSLFEKGQYVLCKLEFNSEGVKSKKRKRSVRIAPVSRSEIEPSQNMDSDSENINPSEMAVNSPCDESGLSHHVGFHFGNQNSGEMMNSSARQPSEFSHHRTSEFRNQNSNNLTSDLVHDRSGSSHSTVFNRENQYWNQPAVDSAYNGSGSPYSMAFDSETHTLNELPAADSAYNVSRKLGMAFDLANQNPNGRLTADSASNFVSESRYMPLDLANQNPNVLLTDDNVASNVSESHCMGLNWENKNLCNSISIFTCENSSMASRGSEIQEPPFPFPPKDESGDSMVMPSSIINQSTYDKSDLSSLISSDFDYQNLTKEIDISAFDEGAWSNTTATPPDFGNQNPCKKPDMSAALEEDYSSYFDSFFSDSYLADVALPEVSPGLQAEMEGCFEQENIPSPALNLHSNTSKAQADTLRVTCTSSSSSHQPPFSTRADTCPLEIIHQPFFPLPLLVSVLGRGMDNDFLSVMANPIALQQLMEYGFKFEPSDEKLFSKYLVPKTRGDIMKGFPMEDVNLCEHEPWDLPGKSIINVAGQVAWYFFCPRDLRGKGHRRKTKAGNWKPTGNPKSIMAEGTENEIGVIRALRFYQREVITGWMIYEFDLISEPTLFEKGQYVLCKLECNSEGVKSKKRKRSDRIAPVSRSEDEPSQSMDSDSENINPIEMAVNSPCDESGLNHHVGLHFGNQNSGELMNSSARPFSEFSHHRTSEFRNQISNNLTSDLAHDGSGSSHSTVFNRENQYWNQPAFDSAYNGSESPYIMAFDSETQTPNELLAADSASNVVIESRYMTSDLANKNLCNSISILTCENSLMASRGSEIQEPPFPFPHEGESGNSMVMPCSFTNQSTYDKSEPSSLISFDFDYQNLSKEIDISAFGEGVRSNITATPPDFVNQNPCKKPDMSALEEVYSSYSESFFSDSYVADLALAELSPGLQAEIEGCFEHEPNMPLTDDNSASNVSESHYMALDWENKNLCNNISILTCENSLMASRGSEIQEPPFPFPPKGESGNSMVMPSSIINQSTYDKSELSSLISSDFDYQNLSKEIDISAFDEGVWSDITATPPDFVNQNPCKKPDMSAALEEVYSSKPWTTSRDGRVFRARKHPQPCTLMANPIALLLLMEYGFKFQPSVEECFSKYLVPKTRGDIMEGFPMEDVNLCEHEPRNLPEYFFCPRDHRGKVQSRKTKTGRWKQTCKAKSIMAEGTEKEIGVMRTLRFYEGEVTTDWMIYEFDLISERSLFQKGQYVLCKLECNSEGVKSKKRKRSHRIAPVSRSEVEPRQSMDSDSENINPSEMAVNSPCDESGLSHHVGLQFGNQNSGELMNSSARQFSESSHHRTSEFRNQISNNLMSDLAHDGSGSSHSTVFNRENQYWNQPPVDSAYNGSGSPYIMAFDSETQTPNELPAADSAYNVSRKLCMAFDLANQNPNGLLTADSASNFVSESRYMPLDLANQNPNVLLTDDNVASNVSESHYMALDWENKNLCNSISILTCENSWMASRGSEIQEPPFPFPPGGESGNSMVMPCSFINQSTYDKSEPRISFDFDHQNLSKENEISAFGEGVWSNTTATPPDFGNQNPCKKPDMSALEEIYSSYPESFFSGHYVADLALPGPWNRSRDRRVFRARTQPCTRPASCMHGGKPLLHGTLISYLLFNKKTIHTKQSMELLYMLVLTRIFSYIHIKIVLCDPDATVCFKYVEQNLCLINMFKFSFLIFVNFWISNLYRRPGERRRSSGDGLLSASWLDVLILITIYKNLHKLSFCTPGYIYDRIQRHGKNIYTSKITSLSIIINLFIFIESVLNFYFFIDIINSFQILGPAFSSLLGLCFLVNFVQRDFVLCKLKRNSDDELPCEEGGSSSNVASDFPNNVTEFQVVLLSISRTYISFNDYFHRKINWKLSSELMKDIIIELCPIACKRDCVLRKSSTDNKFSIIHLISHRNKLPLVVLYDVSRLLFCQSGIFMRLKNEGEIKTAYPRPLELQSNGIVLINSPLFPSVFNISKMATNTTAADTRSMSGCLQYMKSLSDPLCFYWPSSLMNMLCLKLLFI
ncbi:hypothetical protein SADUNF_Sadunf14G0052500 [Salix dunnii]|uniref:NAC domain-containing protein n=1 Tax=Salix dunnii TaxID=1413687 RepID=A0A835JIC8_9ROSI|nr:hypothetical protein SADUNF_Sadunf14G0052500 [Salix dunnii]